MSQQTQTIMNGNAEEYTMNEGYSSLQQVQQVQHREQEFLNSSNDATQQLQPNMQQLFAECLAGTFSAPVSAAAILNLIDSNFGAGIVQQIAAQAPGTSQMIATATTMPISTENPISADTDPLTQNATYCTAASENVARNDVNSSNANSCNASLRIDKKNLEELERHLGTGGAYPSTPGPFGSPETQTPLVQAADYATMETNPESRSAPSNTCSAVNDNANNGSSKTENSSGLITAPCKARGMPFDHNAKTAYLVIPKDAKHGTELICSHPACKEEGVKFCYCIYCRVPVAKCNFRRRHSHPEEFDDNAALMTTATKLPTAVSDNLPPDKMQKKDEGQPGGIPTQVLANMSASQDAKQQPRVSSSDSDSTSMHPSEQSKLLQKKKEKWEALLFKRPRNDTGLRMSKWLMEVVSVSKFTDAEYAFAFGNSTNELSNGSSGEYNSSYNDSSSSDSHAGTSSKLGNGNRDEEPSSTNDSSSDSTNGNSSDAGEVHTYDVSRGDSPRRSTRSTVKKISNKASSLATLSASTDRREASEHLINALDKNDRVADEPIQSQNDNSNDFPDTSMEKPFFQSTAKTNSSKEEKPQTYKNASSDSRTTSSSGNERVSFTYESTSSDVNDSTSGTSSVTGESSSNNGHRRKPISTPDSGKSGHHLTMANDKREASESSTNDSNNSTSEGTDSDRNSNDSSSSSGDDADTPNIERSWETNMNNRSNEKKSLKRKADAL